MNDLLMLFLFAPIVKFLVSGASNLIVSFGVFFTSVAVAITIFGPESGAVLACVVSVLVEVPVMLSVCSFCNHTRHWFPHASA